MKITFNTRSFRKDSIQGDCHRCPVALGIVQHFVKKGIEPPDVVVGPNYIIFWYRADMNDVSTMMSVSVITPTNVCRFIRAFDRDEAPNDIDVSIEVELSADWYYTK